MNDVKPHPDEALFEDIDHTLLTGDELIDLSSIAERVNDRGVQGLTVAQFVRMKELQTKGQRQQD